MNWLPSTIAISTTVVIFITLQVRRRTPTDILFLGGLSLVTVCGVITPAEAMQGFASNAILTIAALFVCAEGLRSAGVLDWVGAQLLGSARTERSALFRLAAALLGTSAFVLNTAVVAMLMPVVIQWCRRCLVSPSRLLIPLSYLTILGGVCTLIGTSTTLVVNAELHSLQQKRVTAVAADAALDPEARQRAEKFADDLRPMQLFEIGRAGVPCAVIGALTLLVLGPWLLPNRREVTQQFGESLRDYLVEMKVEPDCRLVGQSVDEAGLRQLHGLFLAEISREREVITPVSPEDVIQAGDHLVFTGVVSTIIELNKIPGLVPIADEDFETEPIQRRARNLTEVVLSRSCPLIGTTVKDRSFRQRYNAAVMAVHRNGVRVTNKIGNIILEAGDTLLLQTRSDFVKTFCDSRDFYLVSNVQGATPRRHEKAPLAAGLGLGLVVWLCLGTLFRGQIPDSLGSSAVAAMTVAVLMVVTRCLPVSEARGAIDISLLVTIAGALGMARALQESGAADLIATSITRLVGEEPWLLLATVYLLAMLFTEMITNNAVAATLLPVAVGVAAQTGVSPRPFVMAIALASSLSFLTPIGYQTNLMVMGPGGYYPRDYLRVGFPLSIVVATTAIVIIPIVWPF
ncbi:MAG: SLC13 family permease [Planctomycetota bacterium]